jgi:hypothetical protein
MRKFSKTKLAANLALTIFGALGTIYAGTAPAQITITGADLAAAQGVYNSVLASGQGILYAQGAARPASTFAPPMIPAVTFGFYPGDVQNPNNNPTLKNLTVHDIFVNPFQPSPGMYSQGSAGGPTLTDADNFSANLFASNFIHVSDQYTGDPAAVRTVGQAGVITYTVYRTTYSDNDIAILVHAAARTFGSGPNQLFHIYFAQGTDVCVSGGTQCYSPDVPSTFYFCGFHDNFNFADLGRVVYSAEPYANVNGCAVPTSPAGISPNGPAIDSMANVVGHETFEAITDPLVNAWYNHFGPFAGNEIADECAFVFAIPSVVLNGSPYQVQSVYSNYYHACSWVP